MTARSLLLFVHIVGMLLLFVGLGVEWLAASLLPRANAAVPRIAGLGVGLMLLSGIYLALREDAFHFGWVGVSMGAMFVIGILGRPTLQARVPAVLAIRTAAGLAIVFLMIAKLDLVSSLLVMTIALALGAVAGAPLRRALT
jgi:hypothetical protein